MIRPLLLALLVAALPAHAADTLRAAFDAAWARSSAAQSVDARRAVGAADRALADSLLAAAPSVTIAQRDDRHQRALGVREQEVELTLPLWRPGERAARRTQAERADDEAIAATAAARLALAGDLREAAHALAGAGLERTLAAERSALADALLADTARREAAGDLARTDVLLATDAALIARAALAEAQAQTALAHARYRQLTGLDAPPAPVDEDDAPPPAEHPRHAAAASAVAAARAALDAARQSGSDAPELTLGWQRARESFAGADAQTLRVAVRLPFDGPARRAPALARANAELIHAEAEAQRTTHELEAERAAAEAQLAQARARSDLAAQREAAAAERASLLERAFRLGERGLAEFIDAQAAQQAAHAEAARASAALRVARSRLLQAKGILP